jgi:hypothetical protein
VSEGAAPIGHSVAETIDRAKQCRGHYWDRDLLEPPVFQELRRLASHPDLIRQLALADRHATVFSSPRLTGEIREDIEHQTARIDQEIGNQTQRYVEQIQHGQDIDGTRADPHSPLRAASSTPTTPRARRRQSSRADCE